MASKNDVLMYFLMYFRHKTGCSATLLTPPPQSVLLLLQTTQQRERSSWAVVRSPAWCQSEYQSVSGPGPWRVWAARFSVGPCLSLFLSRPLLLHQSGSSRKGRLYSQWHIISYTQHPSCTGIFLFRPQWSITIGPEVRFNYTSTSLWCAVR